MWAFQVANQIRHYQCHEWCMLLLQARCLIGFFFFFFYQIVLDEESAKMCTFNTPFGRHCFLRLPFGIREHLTLTVELTTTPVTEGNETDITVSNKTTTNITTTNQSSPAAVVSANRPNHMSPLYFHEIDPWGVLTVYSVSPFWFFALTDKRIFCSCLCSVGGTHTPYFLMCVMIWLVGFMLIRWHEVRLSWRKLRN